ncbi:TIGR03089 family protein [Terrabacter aerolatus]|uniref:Acyl-CoA synthetase n=1 Tax=Terrabacter aerolatus TaxID=422442 RepID=A0A512D3I4_9MICO|nr:TIGR03089 family protein [Terrabacter aerolatus]GEO31026.1 acyl-CoA synthetase [Terrabacter aerolatus]
MTTPTLPAEVLARMVASDPGRPRLTWYDDGPGPTAGERIELSARVLANWVSKAANLLQDDAAAGPGTTVGLDLPAHWRSLYWALATWSVGATIVVGAAAAGADVLVTDSPAAAAGHGGDAVLVALPALARSHPEAGDAPGAVDEARELATHGDLFSPMSDPEPGDVALAARGDDTAYGHLVVVDQSWGPAPRVALAGDLEQVLRQSLAAWAVDGSIVLMRSDRADLADRLASEGVTLDARETA